MQQPVLAAIDGSPQSIHAAQWAADEAARRGVPLRLLHAGPWLTAQRAIDSQHGDDQGTALSLLAHTQAEVHHRHPELPVETGLVQGQVTDALVSVAGDGQLLVLGSRGLGGFAGLLVGSVSLAVAARAQVPVVVVRPMTDTHAEGQREQEIVVGVDAGLAAQSPLDAVLEFAFAEAALRGARIRAVHGWDVPPAWPSMGVTVPMIPSEDLQSAEAAQLTKVLLPWREKFPAIEVVEQVRIGGGAAPLVYASARAELVVIGRRLRPHAAGMRLGSVAHAVIHHAQAPTVVVPHP